ncbi:hypothetical protein MAFF212519_10930 [Clavibacter michiganensis]
MPLPLRILFSFARGQGHLNPLMPFARAARARGHETALAGPRELVAGRADFAPLFPSDTGAARTEGGTGRLVVADPRRPYAQVEEVFLGEAARTAARSVDEAIAGWTPSLVVCDEFDFGAMVAAERAGVPVVVVEVTASAYSGWRPSVAHALDALRTEAGLAPDPGLAMLAGDLLVVPFPESVAGAGPGAASGSAYGAEPAPRSVLRVRPEAPETADDHPAVRWLAAGDEPGASTRPSARSSTRARGICCTASSTASRPRTRGCWRRSGRAWIPLPSRARRRAAASRGTCPRARCWSAWTS